MAVSGDTRTRLIVIFSMLAAGAVCLGAYAGMYQLWIAGTPSMLPQDWDHRHSGTLFYIIGFCAVVLVYSLVACLTRSLSHLATLYAANMLCALLCGLTAGFGLYDVIVDETLGWGALVSSTMAFTFYPLVGAVVCHAVVAIFFWRAHQYYEHLDFSGIASRRGRAMLQAAKAAAAASATPTATLADIAVGFVHDGVTYTRAL